MMAFEFRTQPRFLKEVLQIKAFYEIQKAGLGEEWEAHFDSTVNLIQIFPFQFEEFETNYRKAPVSRFPYSIFYFLSEEEQLVIFTTIQHQRAINFSFRV